MIGRILDRFVGLFAPQRAVDRIRARRVLAQQMEWDKSSFTGANQDGYEAAKRNRLNRPHQRGRHRGENALSQDQLDQLVAGSWDLWRNNGHARKIVRQITAKVLGPKGLQPQSLAVDQNGEPHDAFRDRVSQLWRDIGGQLDYRGRSYRGGLTVAGLQEQALRNVVLGGNVFYRLLRRSQSQQEARNLRIPFQVQLLPVTRLSINPADGLPANSRYYRGIEYRGEGTRSAYHFLKSTGDTLLTEAVRISVREIGHLYIQDDVDQFLGMPWFSGVLMNARDTGDYQYNELKASALAACIALGVRRPSGATTFGLKAPTGWEEEDADENNMEFLQPGMLIHLGDDGGLEPFNPSRPNANAEPWIKHMMRTTAVGLPGIKPSAVIGDYKGASFSSERSADNDIWPELECLQEWMAANFNGVILRSSIRAAMLDGYFDGIITTTEFAASSDNFLRASWHGPVARSINPKDDATAANLRVKGGISSPQIEAAKVNQDWRAICRDVSDFVTYAEELGLPTAYVNNVLGISVNSQLTDQPLELGEENEELLMVRDARSA